MHEQQHEKAAGKAHRRGELAPERGADPSPPGEYGKLDRGPNGPRRRASLQAGASLVVDPRAGGRGGFVVFCVQRQHADRQSRQHGQALKRPSDQLGPETLGGEGHYRRAEGPGRDPEDGRTFEPVEQRHPAAGKQVATKRAAAASKMTSTTTAPKTIFRCRLKASRADRADEQAEAHRDQDQELDRQEEPDQRRQERTRMMREEEGHKERHEDGRPEPADHLVEQ